MADESKALQMIADVLQHIMNERKESKEMFNQLRESTIGQRPDFTKQQTEREEYMREIKEDGKRRHEEQRQFEKSLLATLTRLAEAQEQNNALLARLLERGGIGQQ